MPAVSRRIKLRLMMMFKMEMLPAEACRLRQQKIGGLFVAKVDFLDRWLVVLIVNASQL